MTKEETLAYIKAYLDGNAAVGNIITLRSVLESAIKYLSEPSLPSNLDEAANEEADRLFADMNIDGDMIYLPTAKALMIALARFGAEWMAGQGYTQEEIVEDKSIELGYGVLPGISPIINLPDSFKPGDKVVVQIRKKQ